MALESEIVLVLIFQRIQTLLLVILSSHFMKILVDQLPL